MQPEPQPGVYAAAFSYALAGAGVGCNVVAGAWHDHLFVSAERAHDAMTVLQTLQRSSPAK